MGLFSKHSAPPPPPPPPPPQQHRGQTHRPPQQTTQQYPAGSFAIGVETEFLIQPLRSASSLRTIEDFSRNTAAGYMTFLQTQPNQSHPGMHNAIHESFTGQRYSQWSLDIDSTIETPYPGREPWGIEAISPILRVHAGSGWRSHISVMWDYLSRNYHVSANNSCGTHVHMSVVGGYTLETLKRVACSVLHFEPAFEALLPRDRLGNEYTKSNWIDNKNFGHRNVSREQAIRMVLACTDIRSLILLMNPDNEGERDKMFGWNFLNLLQDLRSTIEFRRGAASTSAPQVFMWIEITMSFISASMERGTIDTLERVPGTVGGLKAFINSARLPNAIFDARLLANFYGSVPDGTSKAPIPVGRLTGEKARKLERKKAEDKNRNIMLAKTLHEPYWD